MADISAYGFDLPHPVNRDLFFTDQVEQKTVSDLTKSIINVNASDRYLEKLYASREVLYTPKPINIYIDSYGGAVYQCFGLLSVMARSVTPVHTIVTGTAMSCGFMITICGHKRFCHELSTLMYHQVSSGNGRGTKVKDLEESLEETQRLQSKIEELTIKKTGISLDKIKEVYKAKHDWFLTAEESLKCGCIDEILR